MEDRLKKAQDRIGNVEHQLEELQGERERLANEVKIIRASMEYFFPSTVTIEERAANDTFRIRDAVVAVVRDYEPLSIQQAILAVLKENGNKWTPIAEFEAELNRRGKKVGYASIDQTIRGSKLSEKLETKKEGNRNFFRLKQ
jgi:hypothetical protein